MKMHMVTVYGWPDKRNDDPTRIVFTSDSQRSEDAVNYIANLFGGLFRLDFVMIDKPIARSVDEALRAMAIVAFVSTGLDEYTQKH